MKMASGIRLSRKTPLPGPALFRVWGGARTFVHHSRQFHWMDLLVILGVGGLIAATIGMAREWHGQLTPAAQIDLSLRALPRYAVYSLFRGLLAYVLSLSFTLLYGYWAAKDRVAERVLVPLLDILQSIPVLGFMPGLVLAMVALFPRTNAGLELAAILMIFTGQVWNMTFSFYHSLLSIPADMRDAGTIYRFSWWHRLRWVELPFSAMGLVWNSMMSMAGGWFFLMISESFILGNRDFRLPGLGSFMSAAVEKGDARAMIAAVVAMVFMIVALDQFLWRPVVVWAQKFRTGEGGRQEVASSWFLGRLRRSLLLRWLKRLRPDREFRAARAFRARSAAAPVGAGSPDPGRRTPDPGGGSAGPGPGSPDPGPGPTSPSGGVAATPSGFRFPAAWLSPVLFSLLTGLILFGLWKLGRLILGLSAGSWPAILGGAGLTLGRVLAAVALGTIWTVPAGLAIGLSPKLSRALQPIVQVVASFPAPMLFPAVVAALQVLHVSLDWGSILLMLLGTQWYILFNVVAGAMAIPSDLQEAARSFRFGRSRRFWALLAPAVFPYLVTGWVTAAGGAWNASIVSEYVSFKGRVLAARGLGSAISRAAERAEIPTLAASVAVMAAVVVLFNRLVWRRLYRLAEDRFSIGR